MITCKIYVFLKELYRMYNLSYCVRLVFTASQREGVSDVSILGECRLINTEKRGKLIDKRAMFEGFNFPVKSDNMVIFWRNFISCMKDDRVRGWFKVSKRKYKSADIQITFERDMEEVAGFDELESRYHEMVKMCIKHFYDMVAYIKTIGVSNE